MAFNASAIFVQSMFNPLMASAWSTAEPTTYGANGLSADTINVALFGNSGTPSKTVTAANTCYAVDQWIVGNETNGGANWPAGGLALASKGFAVDGTTTNAVAFSAANLAGTGNVTVAAAYGCLVYDNTITVPAHQGLCYNYFGGSQSVTAGTFTINWFTTSYTNPTVFSVTV